MEAVPKSREERLRDFYAQRSTALEESTPWQLQVSEEKEEAHELRKTGNDFFEAQDYEAAVEQYTAAIKKLRWHLGLGLMLFLTLYPFLFLLIICFNLMQIWSVLKTFQH